MPALKQQTAKKRASGKTANPVKPVKGPVDYKALRKELIGAFPKTLARLAE
jgi:hypothetical protein